MIENEIAKLEKPDQDSVQVLLVAQLGETAFVIAHLRQFSHHQPPEKEVRPRSGHRAALETRQWSTPAAVSPAAEPPCSPDDGWPLGRGRTLLQHGDYGLDLNPRHLPQTRNASLGSGSGPVAPLSRNRGTPNDAARTRPHRRPACAARCATGTSTPSSWPSPTCRAGCRASGSTPSSSSTPCSSTAPRAATTCSPSTST